MQRHTFGQVNGTFLVVGRVVVGVILVAWSIVFGEIFFDVYLLGLLLFLIFGRFFFEYGILLDFLLDALLELQGRKLQQFDHLDLLRRQLLEQFLNLALIKIGHSFSIFNN